MKRSTLTAADISTLARAVDLRRRFDAGIFPATGGDHAHFRRLERLGLIEFDNWGRDLDGEVDRDVQIYKLTTAGTQALQHAEPLQPRGTPQ